MSTSAPSRDRPGLRRWVVDAAIAGAVTVCQVGLAYQSAARHGLRHGHPGWLGYLLLVAGGMSLLGRRRYPVPVLAVTLGTALWTSALGVQTAWLALIAAFFNAVLARKRAAAIASLIIGYVVSVWPPWLIGSAGHPTTTFALALLAGLITLLSAAELNRAWYSRSVAVRRGREEEEKRRASEQRLAIARDLHDVVAHNISVINVQANTALHLMDRQPERAREALTAIHDVSKQALAELRSVLGVLRADGQGAPLAPSPGLDRLDELASHARSAGIAVRLLEEGTPRPLPAGVDVAAYRIVQEALTNTVRHSGGSTATVHLRYDADALTIEVADDGTAMPPAHPGRPGNGMPGMTERARALGGTLEAGPSPGGGFRVLARLPA
jgi:signal transduction histidine kinase